MASDEAERLAALIERLQRHARIIRACRELQDGMHEPDPEDLDAAIAALLRTPAAPPPAPEKKQEIRRQTAIMDAVAAAAPFPEAP